jgi:hypothetical protein
MREQKKALVMRIGRKRKRKVEDWEELDVDEEEEDIWLDEDEY